jgi:hypothetical protein
MSVKKKPSSAADVLRQEMQQPLVIPERTAASDSNRTTNTPNPTSTTNTNMNSPTNDADTIAQLKAAQEKEAKVQQQKFDALKKEFDDAKQMIVKLTEQGQAPAKGKTTAIVKKDTSRSNSSITARPTESREETARRRANTDIGWLD